MKVKAARALARVVKKPTERKIIPGPFEGGVIKAVASAIR
jgi:malic enzyme